MTVCWLVRPAMTALWRLFLHPWATGLTGFTRLDWRGLSNSGENSALIPWRKCLRRGAVPA